MLDSCEDDREEANGEPDRTKMVAVDDPFNNGDAGKFEAGI